MRLHDSLNLVNGDELVLFPTAGTLLRGEYDVPLHVTGTDFYYSQLNAQEQDCYDLIAAGCRGRESEISLNPISEDAFYKAQTAYSYDHPETFWIHSFTTVSLNEQIESVEYQLDPDLEAEAAGIEKAAADICAGIPAGADEYGIVRYFYETLIRDTAYSAQADDIDQDIRSVFLNHASVCTGYTRAFQLLCERAGIWCTMAVGTASEDSHSWNLVRISGNYYWVDVTWGDPVFTDSDSQMIDYNYLCVSDAQLLKTHVLDHGIRTSSYQSDQVFEYPSCTDDSLNYFRLTGSWFDDYDAEQVWQYLLQIFQSGRRTADLKFADDASYQQASQDLFREDALRNVLSECFPAGCSYRYTVDDASDYIRIEITT